jgi:predicted lipoprotein with Yx(FWY)xxD motif
MLGRRSRAWLAGCVGVAAFAMAVAGATTVARAQYNYSHAYTVDTATIMVGGASTRVLTDASGKTLYYLATDTPMRSTCTGSCATIWPPLLSDSAPATEAPLPGKLALVKTANGSQVSYNGHLLYTYSGDTAAHQANGQGVAGQWSVARVDLKPAMTGTTGAPATTKNDYGRGGGY